MVVEVKAAKIAISEKRVLNISASHVVTYEFGKSLAGEGSAISP
jgi:hypothetical protein